MSNYITAWKATWYKDWGQNEDIYATTREYCHRLMCERILKNDENVLGNYEYTVRNMHMRNAVVPEETVQENIRKYKDDPCEMMEEMTWGDGFVSFEEIRIELEGDDGK